MDVLPLHTNGPGASAAPLVEIRGLVQRFGNQTVLDGSWLAAQQGEIVTLLGPSGCGKTTLLRCIAGFLTPAAGEILIDGRDTVSVPVNRRPVGVVFQSYALFPHMTVARNVGYGLRLRGLPRSEVQARVVAALATVSLSGFGERYPSQLSGGQQQRVAIARVLVLEPRVLLLDEPFNALDAKLRGGMQVELRRLIKHLGMTAIFVTHDQEEALTVSDRIAVMRAGRVEQLGTPAEIYDRPASAYVADFVGASNFWAARSAAGRVLLPDGTAVRSTLDGAVTVMLRPENLELRGPGPPELPWQGRIAFRKHAGAVMEYEVEMPGGEPFRVVALRDARRPAPEIGDRVSLGVRDPGACAVFPQA